ncbi:hypothetical protein DYB30_006557 [Aphanomyces astaci]|uniref:Uncharacterized protein n=3 Tax=Aphanomyces astaci TaxID=112090 RepID=A0A397B1V2_APHAT|nr:hypothetical protein DYB36_004719 [Aphanomyces astaci]RHY39007.1 hypothetical protein DYB34_006802 [Aphanomyces astaci]RHY78604.1 hypothetical protein DYB30_006557 [Aphanomyces astaci]
MTTPPTEATDVVDGVPDVHEGGHELAQGGNMDNVLPTIVAPYIPHDVDQDLSLSQLLALWQLPQDAIDLMTYREWSDLHTPNMARQNKLSTEGKDSNLLANDASATLIVFHRILGEIQLKLDAMQQQLIAADEGATDGTNQPPVENELPIAHPTTPPNSAAAASSSFYPANLANPTTFPVWLRGVRNGLPTLHMTCPMVYSNGVLLRDGMTLFFVLSPAHLSDDPTDSKLQKFFGHAPYGQLRFQARKAGYGGTSAVVAEVGRMAEVLVFDNVLSDDAIDAVHLYLHQKWAIPKAKSSPQQSMSTPPSLVVDSPHDKAPVEEKLPTDEPTTAQPSDRSHGRGPYNRDDVFKWQPPPDADPAQVALWKEAVADKIRSVERFQFGGKILHEFIDTLKTELNTLRDTWFG